MTATVEPDTAGATAPFSHRARRALSRAVHVPPPTTEYTVHRGLRVPMRDGVELIADHYAPRTAEPAGTLLVRGPYGRRFPFSALFGTVYARRGYHVVVQSVRGTFGSGGEFTPMVHEQTDGADTAKWLCGQPWFTGTFATVGLSYLGFTQWALLADPPPQMAAAVITVGPHDLSASSWGTGSFTLNDFLGWSDLVARQEEAGAVRAVARQVTSQQRVKRAADGLPLGEAGRALLRNGAPWYESWLEHPDPADEFWDRLRLTDALERVQVPVLLIGGWQDLFLDQTLAQYRRLRDRGVPVAVTVGSWTHMNMTAKAAPTLLRESLDWLGTHLGGAPTRRRSPVRIHVHQDGWLDLPDWPPTMPEQVLYLQPRNRLGSSAPATDAAASRFTFDPAHPTPTVGGRLLSPAGGYRRDAKLAERADVLSFTGEPLPADLYVVGTPVIELAHSCDNPHYDLFVRVSEVDAKGRSRNVTEGFRRFQGAAQDGILRIELDATAHRFRAGSRIRVLVAGGSHPRFARNPGTGEVPVSARRLVPATHTVHHGTGGVSRLILPADSRPPTAAEPASL